MSCGLRMWMRTDGFELDTFSYIHAEPGSRAQNWHTDVQPLHMSSSAAASGRPNSTAAAIDAFGASEAQASALALAMPAHGLVQITPLVDVAPSTGASHGSSRLLARQARRARARSWRACTTASRCRARPG